jgi:hypothetical protein
VNNNGAYVWYRTAAGADAISTTHNSANYLVAFEFLEFEVGSTFLAAASATAVASGAAGPSVTLAAGTKLVVGVASNNAGASAPTPVTYSWSSGVEVTECGWPGGGSPATDGGTLGTAILEDSTATSVSMGVTYAGTPASTNMERIVFGVTAVEPVVIGPAFDSTAFDPAGFSTDDVVAPKEGGFGGSFSLAGSFAGREVAVGSFSGSVGFTGAFAGAAPLTGVGDYRSEMLALSPALYLRLGETSGTTAADLGSNGLAGTYSGAYTLGVASPGMADGDTAVGLARTGAGLVSVPHHSTLQLDTGPGKSWSLVFRMRVDTRATTWPGVMVKGSTSVGWGIYNSAGNGMVYKIGGSEQFSGAGTVALGEWHHWTLTYDGANLRWYRDGELLASPAYAAAINRTDTSTLDLNRMDVYGDTFLDEVAVVRSTLSPTQISRLVAAQAVAPAPSGPVASFSGLLSLAGAFAGRRVQAGSFSRTVSFAGAFAGRRVPTSSFSRSVTFSGAFAGHRVARGGFTGAATFAGAFAGRRVARGSISGSVVFAPSFQGRRVTSATFAGATSWSGAFTGATPAVAPKSGSFASSISFAGSFAGARAPRGSFAGSLQLAGAFAGRRVAQGSFSRSVAFVGAFSGRPMPGGSFSRSISFAGAFQGRRAPVGSFSRSVTLAGSFTGRRVQASSFGGSLALSGGFAGRRVTSGVFARGISFAGSFSGVRTPRGAFSGAVQLAGTFSGFRPVVGAKTGTFSRSIAFAGAFAGRRVPRGSFSSSIAWTGSFAGSRPAVNPKSGGFASSVSWSGTFAGRRAPRGGFSGAVSLAGAFAGRRVSLGAFAASVGLQGAFQGRRIPIGGFASSYGLAGSFSGVVVRGGEFAGVVDWRGEFAAYRVVRDLDLELIAIPDRWTLDPAGARWSFRGEPSDRYSLDTLEDRLVLDGAGDRWSLEGE